MADRSVDNHNGEVVMAVFGDSHFEMLPVDYANPMDDPRQTALASLRHGKTPDEPDPDNIITPSYAKSQILP